MSSSDCEGHGSLEADPLDPRDAIGLGIVSVTGHASLLVLVEGDAVFVVVCRDPITGDTAVSVACASSANATKEDKLYYLKSSVKIQHEDSHRLI